MPEAILLLDSVGTPGLLAVVVALLMNIRGDLRHMTGRLSDHEKRLRKLEGKEA